MINARNLGLFTQAVIGFGLATALSAQAPIAIDATVETTDSATQQPSASSLAERNFDGFAAARSEILALISGATQNIRVVTDFLSDGEIVSALYIAQYRKVNVQVLLGSSRATSVLSRLNFLKAQNIPVWLRPRAFMSAYPTVILVDQNLYALNAELDYMARHRKFTLTPLPQSALGDFETNFQAAAQAGISPSPKPTPLVGKPSGGKRRSYSANYEPNTESTPVTPSYSDSQPGQDGNSPYRYNRRKEKPSTGIPTKLPKTTILQDREKH